MSRPCLLVLISTLLVTTGANADPVGDNLVMKRVPPNFTSGTLEVWGGPVTGWSSYGGINHCEVASSPAPCGEGALVLLDPHTGYLNAFCIELVQASPSSYVPYDVVMPKDAPDPGEYVPGPMGFVKQEYLRELWGRHYDTATTSGEYAEVFSACIKEIEYEDNASVWDVTTIGSPDGRGYRCAGTDTVLANQWLASLDGTGPKADLRALTNPDYQDFLVEVVPEPTSVTLMLTGSVLVGLVGTRRRHRRK